MNTVKWTKLGIIVHRSPRSITKTENGSRRLAPNETEERGTEETVWEAVHSERLGSASFPDA